MTEAAHFRIKLCPVHESLHPFSQGLVKRNIEMSFYFFMFSGDYENAFT